MTEIIYGKMVLQEKWRNWNMRQIYILFALLLLLLLPDQLLGFEFEPEGWSEIEKKEGNEDLSTIFGNLAILCLIVGNIYIAAKYLTRRRSGDKEIKDTLATLLKVHIIFNVLLFTFTLIHSYYAEATSVLFIITTILMICLIACGAYMKYVPDLARQQRQDLLRLKEIVFGIVLFLLVLGHFLVE